MQAFLAQNQDTLRRTLQLTIKRYCPETLNNMKLYRTQKMIELKGIDREAFIANAIKIIHFSFFLKASRTISKATSRLQPLLTKTATASFKAFVACVTLASLRRIPFLPFVPFFLLPICCFTEAPPLGSNLRQVCSIILFDLISPDILDKVSSVDVGFRPDRTGY